MEECYEWRGPSPCLETEQHGSEEYGNGAELLKHRADFTCPRVEPQASRTLSDVLNNFTKQPLSLAY